MGCSASTAGVQTTTGESSKLGQQATEQNTDEAVARVSPKAVDENLVQPFGGSNDEPNKGQQKKSLTGSGSFSSGIMGSQPPKVLQQTLAAALAGDDCVFETSMPTSSSRHLTKVASRRASLLGPSRGAPVQHFSNSPAGNALKAAQGADDDFGSDDDADDTFVQQSKGSSSRRDEFDYSDSSQQKAPKRAAQGGNASSKAARNLINRNEPDLLIQINARRDSDYSFQPHVIEVAQVEAAKPRSQNGSLTHKITPLVKRAPSLGEPLPWGNADEPTEAEQRMYGAAVHGRSSEQYVVEPLPPGGEPPPGIQQYRPPPNAEEEEARGLPGTSRYGSTERMEVETSHQVATFGSDGEVVGELGGAEGGAEPAAEEQEADPWSNLQARYRIEASPRETQQGQLNPTSAQQYNGTGGNDLVLDDDASEQEAQGSAPASNVFARGSRESDDDMSGEAIWGGKPSIKPAAPPSRTGRSVGSTQSALNIEELETDDIEAAGFMSTAPKPSAPVHPKHSQTAVPAAAFAADDDDDVFG